jgi:hypothetical protein
MQLACRRAKLSVKRAVGRVSVATAAHFDSNADDRSRLPYGALILQLCANSPNSAKLNVAAAPETNAPRHYPLIRLGIRAVSLLSATATATADLNVPFFPALSFCGFCLPPPPSPSPSRPALPFFFISALHRRCTCHGASTEVSPVFGVIYDATDDDGRR